MAGGKFSLANLFGITIRESANDGSDFTNPDADYRRLFLGEDGALHTKDSAGTVAFLGGTGSGTSFPGTPATSSRFFRTDLGDEYRYDGTRWVSMTAYYYPIGAATDQGIAASAILHRAGIPQAADLYVYAIYTEYFVSGGTALSGSHKWVGTVNKTGGVTSTSMGTISIASGASSQWLDAATITVDALMTTSTYKALEVSWVKTGTPGALFAHVIMVYRNVAT